MKITHRSPASNWFAAPESDPVDDDYAAEVQQSTVRGERSYREVQSRLARAEARFARATAQRATAGHRKRLAQLAATVAERRTELRQLEQLMTAPVATDKQIRLRTGLDDHLELGEYKRPASRHITPGPVARARTVGLPPKED